MRRFLIGIVVGVAIAGCGSAVAQVFVSVPTNGVLKGYTVQDSSGRTVCADPSVYNDFRGLGSFIVCE